MYKRFIIIFGIIAGLGIVLVFAGFAASGFDINALSSIGKRDEDYTLREKAFSGEYNTIDLDFDNSSVIFKLSDDEDFHLSYYDSEYYVFSLSDEDNSLSLQATQTSWWKFNFFNFVSRAVRTVTISMPKSFVGDIIVQTKNGSINLQSFDLSSANLSTSNGTITLKSLVVSGDIDASTSNGKYYLQDITSSNINLKTSNGGVAINDVLAKSIKLRTSNGRITAKRIDSEYIDASSSNGNVLIEALGKQSDYKIYVDTSNGKINVQGVVLASKQTINPSAPKYLRAKTSNGSINISFSN